MKKNQLLTGLFLAISLLFSSCDQGEITSVTEPEEDTFALNFNVSTSASDKVVYTKAEAVHDESEFAIQNLILYEYEVADGNENTPQFVRALTSVTADVDFEQDKNFKLINNGNGTYSFTIRFSVDVLNSYRIFKFVANVEGLTTPEENSKIEALAAYSVELDAEESSFTADQLYTNGFVMTGTSKKPDTETNTIQLQDGAVCSVNLKRIVARVDLRYEAPNLLITKVEARNVPGSSKLFEDGTDLNVDKYVTIGMNKNIELPSTYLEDSGEESAEIKKALYLYECKNEEKQHIIIYIEYKMRAGDLLYTGAVEVPFYAVDKYINTERNHLYTIVLGNKDSGGNKLTNIQWIAEDWQQTESDEMVTNK